MRKRKPIAIDLFSGCGGLTTGLRRAGFRVIAAADADPLAMSTYRMNHRTVRRFLGDIRSIKPKDLMNELGLAAGDLDLLAGCPPCQGFSSLRTLNGARKVDHPMNDLVFQIPRFARVLKPRALMIENVPGLLADERFDLLRARLKRLGYRFAADVFNAADFGIPQRRRRMILIAIRKAEPEFAESDKISVSVRDAIAHLVHPRRSDDPVHNYKVSRSERVMKLIRQIPKNGGSRKSLPRRAQLPCHKRSDGFKDIYGRMSWNGPSPTITSGCINPSKGRFLHPRQDRAITLREAALLQGFPPDYRFDLSRGLYPAAQLIGNAFPPSFAEKHARHLRQQLSALAR